ncbi:hypothetical protein SNE40_003793 [Patella caerulea]|uniref:PiggyBac transposable element-derived protein 4 C-terminal zinc-ribbon domain-containing protein n=1 Tax=Patella caerulea TaxID=87958 RepID=A0AAN8K8L4_PATCE
MCICNSWFIVRRNAGLLNVRYTKSLKEFRLNIAEALILVEKEVTKRGRPSFEGVEQPQNKLRRPIMVRPVDDVRYDAVGHWPSHSDKGRCKRCKHGWSRIKCAKCGVVLCLNNVRNCFEDFHLINC